MTTINLDRTLDEWAAGWSTQDIERVTSLCTDQGDLPGMPATGKPFSVRGATALQLDDGRISRNSDYWDMATLLTQLGLMPSPPQEHT
jgi:hypothetical protein